MIIGGQAVLLYGMPRMTKDIDIILGVNINELESVLKAVKASRERPVSWSVENERSAFPLRAHTSLREASKSDS
jgi:hypothetical protein